MKKKLKIIFPNAAYLNNNYGVQGLTLPLVDYLNIFFDCEFTYYVAPEHVDNDLAFVREFDFKVLPTPKSLVAFSRYSKLAYAILFLGRMLKRRKAITDSERITLDNYIKNIKEGDVIIDAAGLEFIGSVSLTRKWNNFLNYYLAQYVAKKEDILYIKYTKSYGPLNGPLFKYCVKKLLNNLPFIFVRGETNFGIIKALKIKPPLYCFPDTSILLKPESPSWAKEYLKKMSLDLSEPIIGISPSSVIREITQITNEDSYHERLVVRLIEHFSSQGRQVLIIPHSIDKRHKQNCDLEFSKSIYNKLKTKKNVYLLPEPLTYQEARSIVGLLDFYVTGRYHGLASALSMATPVVVLSWHIKYKDLLSLFYDDYLAVDSRKKGTESDLESVIKYEENREWHKKEKVLANKRRVVGEINIGLEILKNFINKNINK